MTDMSNVTDLMVECLGFLNSNIELIKSTAPELWTFIENLRPNDINDWTSRSYPLYIVLFASKCLGLSKYAIDAEVQLIEAGCKADEVKLITEGKIKPILEYLNKLHRDANEEVEIFQTAARDLRDMFEDVKGELERLYEDIIQQMFHCAEERENASIFQGLTGLVGVGTGGTAVAASLPIIDFTLPNAITFTLGASSFVSFALCTKLTNAIKTYKDTREHLDRARSTVLEQKIMLQTFITNIDILYIFDRLYTEDELMGILQSWVPELQKF